MTSSVLNVITDLNMRLHVKKIERRTKIIVSYSLISSSVCFALNTNLPIISHLFQGKHRKIAKYYKKQGNLLQGFSEMETIAELGCLAGAPTQVNSFIF